MATATNPWPTGRQRPSARQPQPLATVTNLADHTNPASDPPTTPLATVNRQPTNATKRNLELVTNQFTRQQDWSGQRYARPEWLKALGSALILAWLILASQLWLVTDHATVARTIAMLAHINWTEIRLTTAQLQSFLPLAVAILSGSLVFSVYRMVDIGLCLKQTRPRGQRRIELLNRLRHHRRLATLAAGLLAAGRIWLTLAG